MMTDHAPRLLAQQQAAAELAANRELEERIAPLTCKIAAKVLDVYARLTCPCNEIEISHATCRATSASDVPTSSPQAMRQWRACQSCQHTELPPAKAGGLAQSGATTKVVNRTCLTRMSQHMKVKVTG